MVVPGLKGIFLFSPFRCGFHSLVTLPAVFGSQIPVAAGVVGKPWVWALSFSCKLQVAKTSDTWFMSTSREQNT